MRRNLFNVKIVGVVACIVILSSACNGQTQLASTDQIPVIRYVNFKVYDPVYVALDRGFFTQRGIKVEITGDVLGGPTAIQAVSAGSADAGLSSLPALINANAAGLPVVGVSDIQSALPGQPLEYYYVRSDSGIKSIKDLPGKKFAVNLWRSSFHYTALMAIEQQQIAEDSLEWVLLPFDHQTEALMQGEVDVIGLMEPYNTYALSEHGDQIRLLFDASDVFGDKQFTTHFVNRIWAQYNPNTAQAFVGGIVDAIHWIEKNQMEAKSIIASYTEIPAEYIPEYHFQPDGTVVEEDVIFWLEYLQKRQDVKAGWLKPDTIATNRYNPFLSP
jgi:NitT/TauT family transport system substrate-binding protein